MWPSPDGSGNPFVLGFNTKDCNGKRDGRQSVPIPIKFTSAGTPQNFILGLTTKTLFSYYICTLYWNLEFQY